MVWWLCWASVIDDASCLGGHLERLTAHRVCQLSNPGWGCAHDQQLAAQHPREVRPGRANCHTVKQSNPKEKASVSFSRQQGHLWILHLLGAENSHPFRRACRRDDQVSWVPPARGARPVRQERSIMLTCSRGYIATAPIRGRMRKCCCCSLQLSTGGTKSPRQDGAGTLRIYQLLSLPALLQVSLLQAGSGGQCGKASSKPQCRGWCRRMRRCYGSWGTSRCCTAPGVPSPPSPSRSVP